MKRPPLILVASWWDRLVASDPGLIRLHLAVRTTVTAALAFVVLYGLARATGLPGTMIVLGLVESLFGSTSVRDPDVGQQRVTMLLTPFPAAAAFALGTALAPVKLWSDLAFLVIIFAAVYARRFGPRATALGFLAFIPYFLGNYLHLPLAQIPDQLLSIVIGAALTYVVRFHLLPDRPDKVLTRIVGNFDRCIDRLVAEIEAAIAEGAWHPRRRRRLRRHVARLNDTALMAEDQLDQLDDDRLSDADKGSLSYRLFDLELAADRLADEAVRDLLPAAARDALRQRLDALRRGLRDRSPGKRRPAEAGTPDEVAAAPPPGESGRLARAITALAAALEAPMERNDGAPSRPEEGHKPPDAAAGPENGGLRPTTRQAIQVTVACALAIIAGEMLSPNRWYWAVLTAFIVFSGTQSSGETLVKASQRIIGTLVGVAAGIVIADAVSDHQWLSVLLIFICVFLAYYLSQVAYGAMIFWISIVVALLYNIMGIFTASLLLLRIEETAIGAVIGVAVAILLLPTSTGTATRAAAREFLRCLSDTVERAARRMASERSALDVDSVSRDLDRRFQALRLAARPFASGLAGAVARSGARTWLHLLRSSAYHARDLARSSAQGSAGEDRELARVLAETAARVRRDIEALAELIERRKSAFVLSGDGSRRIREAVATRRESDPRRLAAPDRQRAALDSLDHIDATMELLARRLRSRTRRRAADPG